MRTIKKIFYFTVIGIILSTFFIGYLNYRVFETDNKKELPDNADRYITDIPSGSSCINVVGDYCLYISSGCLYEKYVDNSGKIINIDLSGDILYCKPLADRNIILFVEYDGKDAVLKTYNIENKEAEEQVSILVSNLKSIGNICFSSYTNDIYMLFNKEIASGITSSVYKINIMKHYNLILRNRIIKNIACGYDEDFFCYEDNNGNVYKDWEKTQPYDDCSLIGINKSNEVCIYDRSSNTLLCEGAENRKFNIGDSKIKKVLDKNGDILAITDNYILNTSDFSKINISKGDDVLGVSSSEIYLLKNNKIYVRSIKR